MLVLLPFFLFPFVIWFTQDKHFREVVLSFVVVFGLLFLGVWLYRLCGGIIH